MEVFFSKAYLRGEVLNGKRIYVKYNTKLDRLEIPKKEENLVYGVLLKIINF